MRSPIAMSVQHTTDDVSPPRTRTQPATGELPVTVCAWVACNKGFVPRNPAQRFCSGRCRAAHAREVGIVGTLVTARRLKRSNRIMLDVEDDAILKAPLGTRYRLVREP